MAAANPQPLQARPFEEHGRGPLQIEDDDADYEDDAMDDVEDGNMNSVNVAEHGLGGTGGGAGGGVVMSSRTSELTLSFEGEVYVFPAVTPEKVIILPFIFLFFPPFLKLFWNFSGFY